jgi:hypothetical protein
MSYFERSLVTFNPSDGTTDAFQRVRTSSPTTLFDYTAQYNKGTTFRWAETTATGATITHVPNSSAVQLTITTTSGSKAVRQTKHYFRYQPGKSQQIFITGVMGAVKANTRQRIGYFDGNNGLFFEQDGTNRRVVRRTNTSGTPTDNAVNQSSWNIDKMDGTGTSGITLDFSKTQIFVIDFQWLGVGRVRFGFDVGGVLYYCHEMIHANVLTVPYSTTAILPLRFELEATGTVADATAMDIICMAVLSEGGFETSGSYTFTAGNGITSIGVTTRRPILSIRNRATFNSIVNTVAAIPTLIDVTAQTNGALIELVYNGTLTGASYTNVNTNNSSMEVDTSATVISGGTTIGSFYVISGSGSTKGGSTANIRDQFRMSYDTLASAGDILSIVGTSFSGTSNLTSLINWAEFY